MAELFNSFKKSLVNGEVDLSKETIKVSLMNTTYTPDGVIHIGEPNIFERFRTIFRRKQPDFFSDLGEQVKLKTGYIYIDRGQQKFWDVGMPVKGTGAEIIGKMNFEDEILPVPPWRK
jgi:hypothetical protein